MAIAAISVGLGLATPTAGVFAGNGGTGHHHHHHRGKGGPYGQDGMWIWYVSRSSGGTPDAIGRKARRHGIGTVYVKSSDGSGAWSQFNRKFVTALHGEGLRVCAWQFVYGAKPLAEAARGAEAVAKGADCLVIDAEGQYEGKYAAADAYVDRLRHEIGRNFPTALAGFPYVDYHPGFPYSVFLGPGGARFNLPQLYWHTIGVTVRGGYEHTWRYNRIYERPIHPIGQTYGHPPMAELKRFRRVAISYGFGGISWWDWQETTRAQWRSLATEVTGIPGLEAPANAFPVLERGDDGDMVIWLQEHLRGAGYGLPVTGHFRDRTRRAVKSFQANHGLPVDAVVGTRTWRELLGVKPRMVDWSSHGAKPGHKAAAGGSEPRSASLPAVRYEIPPVAQRR